MSEFVVRNPVDAQVGRNVRRKRIELGSSEVQMAGLMSITLDEYVDCESGKRRFGAINLLKLTRLLNVGADCFYEGLFRAEQKYDDLPRRDLSPLRLHFAAHE
jgi:transcriptional regulator with XRE-family HTH domain